MKLKIIIFSISILISSMVRGEADQTLRLHYNSPANFFEESLVIGNGKIGASVYGGIHTDRLSLNDITFWSGMPDTVSPPAGVSEQIPIVRDLLLKGEYSAAEKAVKKVQGHFTESYLPLGNLFIHHHNLTDSTDYERELNISNASAKTSFGRGKQRIEKEYFASSPDSVIVVRIKTGGAPLDFSLDFNSLVPYKVSSKGNTMTIDGYASYHAFPNYYKPVPYDQKNQFDPKKGIHFRTIVRAVAPGSRISRKGNELTVKGGDEAILIITNETSFNGFDKDPVKEGKDYKGIAARTNAKATKMDYELLKSRHEKDYRHFFDRVKLDLGTTAEEIRNLPTDVQLLRYTDNNERNPELEVLYFQFGRYLLISCSRTPGVPANLQGLWNERLVPSWSCNYTVNINLEENYWLAEPGNLTEMHEPLFGLIRNMQQSGASNAKAFYGVDRGWTLGHNSDIWAITNPVGMQSGDPIWANWNMGGAWIASHIWTHYQYTRDLDFLRQYYPLLKGAAEFCIGWLTEINGKLMTSPGTSPENAFLIDGKAHSLSYGTTSDLAMIRQCVADASAAAATLGVDDKFREEAAGLLARLQPYQIGKSGALQEWLFDFEEKEPTHRHNSHLYGLHPGTHISPAKTPKLAQACRRTLELRGPKSTGWSTGWRVNLYARLLDGENAYSTYRMLLKYISPDKYRGADARRGGGTYPNLLDAHSPFQIDGNFGGSAGVVEMLLQSDGDTITLLPALPRAWNDGEVNGIRARGALTIDMKWNHGKVTEASITADKGGEFTIRANGRDIPMVLNAGETKVIHPATAVQLPNKPNENPFGYPLIPDMVADPSIIEVDSTFYCYVTTDGYGQGLETSGPPVVWKSKDFVNWSFDGTYFPQAENEKYWAPSAAVNYNGKWYIYPTVNGYMYPAVADSPDGPFRLAKGDTFDLKNRLYEKDSICAIDTEIFIDGDGSRYAIWGLRNIARLKDDMVTIDTLATIPTRLKSYTEGPIFFKRNGIYYYLYTNMALEKYEYFYQMSHESPFGPYITPKNDRVCTTNPETGVFGPGHGCVFNPTGTDDYYLVYLEFSRNSTNRQIYVNKLEFNDDGTISQVAVDLNGIGALRPELQVRSRICPVVMTASSTAEPDVVPYKLDARCRRTEYFIPDFASDSSYGSRWMAAENDSTAWLMADFGKTVNVGGSKIFFVRPTAGHAYELECSLDGETWEPCGGHADVRKMSPHTDLINRPLRYLRVRFKDGIKGVWEWEID